MNPIVGLHTDAAPGFERQQWTRVTVRRGDGDYEAVGVWDIRNDNPTLDGGAISLYSHPVGFDQAHHRAPYSFADIDVFEYDDAGPEMRIRMVENAMLEAVANFENSVPTDLSRAIHEHEAYLDAGQADSERCKRLLGSIKRSLREHGWGYDTHTLAACGSRRAINYMNTIPEHGEL